MNKTNDTARQQLSGPHRWDPGTAQPPDTSGMTPAQAALLREVHRRAVAFTALRREVAGAFVGVGGVIAEAHAAGVPITRLAAASGISRATLHRHCCYNGLSADRVAVSVAAIAEAYDDKAAA